jgi:hypothetical protein
LRTVLAPPPEPPPPVGKILRVLLVADTCREHPLAGAHQEAQLLVDLFERANSAQTPIWVVVTALVGPSKATTLDVLLRINDQPPFDVLHYAGPCLYDQQHPEKSGFLFLGGDILTADDLDRVDRAPKFVLPMPANPECSLPDPM